MKRFEEFNNLTESTDTPKFMVGDEVIVLPRLSFYIKNNGWIEDMYDLIGKTYKIRKIEPNSTSPEGYMYSLSNNGYNYVYGDCIELVNKEEKESIKVRWYKKGKLE